MLKIDDLKIDVKFERLTPVSKKEFKALENLLLTDGESYDPIIVWQDQGIIVDGHSRVAILRKHPKLKYIIKEIAFDDWLDVQAWIVEHHIARKSFSLWQKLEMAMRCVDYWETKEQAKVNRGKRTDLLSQCDKKLDGIDINAIIAEKVGCGKTTVTYFMNIFNSQNEGIKQKCREGSMSIRMAYDSLNPKKKKGDDESKGKNEEKPLTIEVVSEDILRDIEKNQSPGKKSNVNIPDPTPIATKMGSTKTSVESVWFAINPIDGVIQVFRKSTDSKKEKNHVKINNYICKPISQEDGVTILEACHIDGSDEEISQKDDVDFEESKKVSQIEGDNHEI